MRVGFGTTTLNKCIQKGELDGISIYCKSILKHLEGNVRLASYAFGENLSKGTVSLGKSYTVPTLRYILTGKNFDIDESSGDISLFHATDHIIPKFKNIPVIANLMDPVPLMNPSWAWGDSKLGYFKNFFFKKMARSADHYIAISDYVVEDLVKYFDIDRDNISVVPLGVDKEYFLRVNQTENDKVLASFSIEYDYFLFIGTLQPRKNIERIVRAYLLLPASTRKSYKLIIVGRIGWGVESLTLLLNDLENKGEVIWLKYVSDLEKKILLSNATALVFTSLYEGFGLPILESYACGTPVITSNVTAMPEVARGASILVDPYNIAEISDAMSIITKETELKRKMISSGLIIAEESSWESCARKTISIYEKLL